MPAGDRTGPMGMGPRTGRAAGFCSGYAAPGYANPMPGRGLGFGRGRGCGRGRGPGRGFCFWPRWNAGQFYAPWMGPEAAAYQQMAPAPEQEKQILQNEAKGLRNALANLEKRIQELETQEQSQE